MTRLHLNLLGGFEARPESGSSLTFRTQKAQALLAYLAVPPGQAHRRDKLAALLWGAMRDEQARASLRQALYDLRKNLGDAAGALRTEGDTVLLDPTAVDLDVMKFTGIAGEETPEALEQAALLYRGDFLDGFSCRRGTVRDVAAGGAGTPARAGDRGAGQKPLTSAKDRRARGRRPNSASATGHRSTPGASPPHAHAAARAAGAAGGRASSVSALRDRVTARAGRRARARDQATLSRSPHATSHRLRTRPPAPPPARGRSHVRGSTRRSPRLRSSAATRPWQRPKQRFTRPRADRVSWSLSSGRRGSARAVWSRS